MSLIVLVMSVSSAGLGFLNITKIVVFLVEFCFLLSLIPIQFHCVFLSSQFEYFCCYISVFVVVPLSVWLFFIFNTCCVLCSVFLVLSFLSSLFFLSVHRVWIFCSHFVIIFLWWCFTRVYWSIFSLPLCYYISVFVAGFFFVFPFLFDLSSYFNTFVGFAFCLHSLNI